MIHIIRKVDDRLVDFLVEVGSLPAYATKASWQEEAEKKLAQKLQRLFGKAFQSMINEVKRRGIPDSDSTKQELIESLIPPQQRFSETIADDAIVAANHGRAVTVSDLQRAGWKISFGNFDSRAVERLREETFKASKDTLERLKGNIMDTLANLQKEGKGTDEVARNLRQHLTGIDEHRLATIARTEINSAQGWGSNRTMVEYGAEYKQWLASSTGPVRDSHQMLHGCVIRVGERYPNGLQYPGDRSGDIAEWINCRCRERVYIPRRGEVITSTPYWP
jgi:SPP1 gp7 family putative phage head morphogenesis protein